MENKFVKLIEKKKQNQLQIECIDVHSLSLQNHFFHHYFVELKSIIFLKNSIMILFYNGV